MEKKHLYLLWTSGDPITAQEMVFKYVINSLIQGWWEEATLIIWGASAQLVKDDREIQAGVRRAVEEGVHVTACKACADDVGATKILEELQVDVRYWGEPLTEVLKNGAQLLTV